MAAARFFPSRQPPIAIRLANGAALARVSFGTMQKNGHASGATRWLAFLLGIGFDQRCALLGVDRGVWVRCPEHGTGRLLLSVCPRTPA